MRITPYFIAAQIVLLSINTYADYQAIMKTGNRLKKQVRGMEPEKKTKPKKTAPPKVREAPVTLPEVTTKEVQALSRKKEAVLLDARFGKHDDKTRIPGAKSLKGKYSASAIRKRLPDKEARIIVYCQNAESPVSTSLARHLKKLGYKNVSVYKAGIDGWKQAGNKVRKVKKRKQKKRK